jgi:inosose dehydratase
MTNIRVANAPCSWGVLEFESTSLGPSPDQVLDEIASTGYDGTELGDWGFLATDPRRLASDLERRHLALVGAFVDVALSDAGAHAAGEDAAVRTAQLIAGASASAPIFVLSDATARVPARAANAGRITPADGLTSNQWDVVAAGASRIARAVRESTGLRTAFHHHCATYVETPEEIDALMQRTPADLLGLCLDTGHATFGGGDPVALIDRFGDRIRHVHFKDCSRAVAERARAEAWDYVTAIRHGVFCELGLGQVDFRGVLDRLRARGYAGWIVVEQDVLPSMGTPAASAARNRGFLRRLGLS